MFMEFCNQGSLQDLLMKQKYLSISESIYVFSQIVEGYKEMRKMEIMHRDIKPANILVNNLVVKISDFGLARMLPDDYVNIYLS